jgi:hypothetical protein
MNEQLTKDQAQHLATFINAVRPSWHPTAIMNALAAARERGPAFDVALAAIRVAANSQKETPAIIPLEGPHWHQSARSPVPPIPPRKCPTCRSYHTEADRCLGPTPARRDDNPVSVGADGMATILNVDPGDTVAQRGIALCRQALADAKAGLCPHGVPWTNCHQHKETA